MCDFKLRLIPDRYPESVIELHNIDDTSINISPSNAVYADCEYKMKLEGNRRDDINNVLIYINGNEENCHIDDNILRFDNKRIFSDYFGFVTIEMELMMESGDAISLATDSISVLIKRGYMSENIDSMLKYIFRHEKGLLYKNEKMSVGQDNVQKTNQDNISSKLKLAEEISAFYENNFGYFNANSRFKVSEIYEIDHIEKMNHPSPKTLQYMVTHPEMLKDTMGSKGIIWMGKNYFPEKTLIPKNYYSTDIEENQVIVGFISKIIYDLEDLLKKIDRIIELMPTFFIPNEQYMHSSSLIFNNTGGDLQDKAIIIRRLLKKFKMLRNLYKEALNVTLIELVNPPKPTPTFMAIPHYNMIFNSIYQWFNFAEYDFRHQNFMLSARNISSLYEIYALCRLLEEIKEKGYTFDRSFECRYPISTRSKFENANCKNTFVFYKGEETLTLYYQPVIYNRDERRINGIGLYRNNSFSLRSINDRGSYYSPDYIVKISTDGKERYSIIDAKFSSKESVENYKVADLCFKYLFSISPVDIDSQIEGLYILYGKCTETDKVSSVYDFEIIGRPIAPKAKLIPVSEKNTNGNLISNII